MKYGIGEAMWHVWGTGEVLMWLWSRDPREGAHLEDLEVDSEVILKWIFQTAIGRCGLDSSLSG
jgi:hypothetical protein